MNKNIHGQQISIYGFTFLYNPSHPYFELFTNTVQHMKYSKVYELTV
jgi:hypothetical protein